MLPNMPDMPDMPINLKDIDYLIVGQGLAGSILAWKLSLAGAKIAIVDNAHHQASSKVAAGLVNPITGKRLVLASDTRNCLEAALNTYQELADSFNTSFFHPVIMLRLLQDEQQKDYLDRRQSNPDYQGLLDKFNIPDKQSPLANEHGSFEQKQTGFLNIPHLLERLKNYFIEQAVYSQDQLNYDDLKVDKDYIRWQAFRIKNIIFCEGHQATHNPWFEWLPFQLAKGEILTVKSSEIKTSNIINRSSWLIPVEEHIYRTGANSEWDFKDDQPTAEGREKVEQNLKTLFKQPVDYQVMAHQAGIRPATRDKQPFIGKHPTKSNLFIFNGFGAKGSMTIPYYAECFTNHLIDNQPLPEQVDIKRLNK